MATEYPESNISGVGLATFGKTVSSNTHGSLTTLNAFDNEMKISSREMLRAAQDHRVDGGDAFAGPLESSDPIFGLSSLPFVSSRSIQRKRSPREPVRFMSARYQREA
jgi:TRAP-type C4-dicarboxylate transport system substrate-binding protein